jgi:hypothetical protein
LAQLARQAQRAVAAATPSWSLPEWAVAQAEAQQASAAEQRQLL